MHLLSSGRESSMVRNLLRVDLVLTIVIFFTCNLFGQEHTIWHISPNRINIQLGDERTLQLLDDAGQGLHGAGWAVDNPEKADIREENGRAVLHTMAV